MTGEDVDRPVNTTPQPAPLIGARFDKCEGDGCPHVLRQAVLIGEILGGVDGPHDPAWFVASTLPPTDVTESVTAGLRR